MDAKRVSDKWISTKILVVAISVSFVSLGMWFNTVQGANYPSSTTTPLAVDLDFNGKQISNIGDIIIKGPWIDLRAFEDNAATDTLQIRDWLNAIIASGGTPGWAPPGTYLIDNDIHVENTIKQRITILGAGDGQTTPGTGTIFKLITDLGSYPMIQIDGGGQEARLKIEGIGFDGFDNSDPDNPRKRPGTGLKIMNFSNRVTVNNSMFQGFSENGLWIYGCIGVNLYGVHCQANGTGFYHDGVSSCGEGVILGCKFATNTTRNVYLGQGSAFLSFIGCTFYGRDYMGTGSMSVELANNVHSIGFHECSFENSFPSIYQPATTPPNQASQIIVEGCSVRSIADTGTQYALNFAGNLSNSRIQHNIFGMKPALGATVVGIRIGGDSKANTIGPNSFSKEGGAGTIIEYSPSDLGKHYGTRSENAASGFANTEILWTDSVNSTVLGAYDREVPGNGGIVNLRDYYSGILVVQAGQWTALFTVGEGLVSIIADPRSKFSTTKDTVGKVNVYWNGPPNSRYEIQNNSGSSRRIAVEFLGIYYY